MSQDSLLVGLLIALTLLGIAIIVALVVAYQYLAARRQIVELKERIAEYGQQEFEKWREKEIEAVRAQSLEVARREMQVEFEQWKSRYEEVIRQDAIQRSQAVTLGKVTEHFVPYLPDFSYNPKDARFIGSPIDFVVFDGLSEGEIRKVVFVEVKTGTSGLSTRERRIREAVCSGNVEWVEIRPVLEASGASNGLSEEKV